MISAIREGIAKNLTKSIPTLRVNPTIPDNPNPPTAVISLNRVGYNKTFAVASQLVEYSFTVTVLVGRVSERTAQNTLDAFCAPSGDGSIKGAIESDQTLSGSAYTCQVTEMTAYGIVSLGDVDYLSAEFSVTVQAL